MKEIKFRANEPLLADSLLDNLSRVFEERYLSPGPWVTRFEEKWANVCSASYAVGTSSGTAALHLALLACDIGPGDEVIVPAMTCTDTLNAVLLAGAQPVIVDIENQRFGIDPKSIDEAVTLATKAIIPVHMYGCPTDPEVYDIAERRGLKVVEDCAEAHGADINGKLVGTIGDVGCFSFRGDKLIGIGTGGMVVTDDEHIRDRANYLIGLASPSGFDRYASTEIGYSYEMSNVHAAIGVSQVDVMDETIRAKRGVAACYDALLPDTVVRKPIQFAGHVYWRYVILLNRGQPRDVHEKLLELGIETLPPFVPMYRLPMYNCNRPYTDFTVSEDVYERLLCLPASPYLRQSEVEYIVDSLLSVL